MRATLVLALLAGCATPAASRPSDTPQAAAPAAPAPLASSRNGPASDWIELRSDNFLLRTDRRPAQARAYLDRLEQTRTALLAAAWGGAKTGGDEIVVTSFDQRTELIPFNDSDTFTGFVHNDGRRTTVVSGGDGRGSEEVLREQLALELTSHFIAQSHQPLWFRRGLAGLLVTIKVPDEADYAEIGEANLHWVRQLNSRGRVPTAELMGAKVEPSEPGDFHTFLATSWLLVHYLYNTRTAEFRRFQLELAQGAKGDQAWRAAFPDLTPEKLDQELTLYLKYGRYQLLRVPLKPVKANVRWQRTMSASEEHAIRARLYLQFPGPRGEPERLKLAKAEVAAARASEPDAPEVLNVERNWASPQEVEAAARAAVARYPGNGQAWDALRYTLDKRHAPREEREPVARQLAATAGDDERLLNNAAWDLGEFGDYAAALPLARRAVQLEESRTNLDTLAVVLSGAGQCAEAVAVEERVIANLDASIREAAGHMYQRHLEQVREHCHPAGN